MTNRPHHHQADRKLGFTPRAMTCGVITALGLLYAGAVVMPVQAQDSPSDQRPIDLLSRDGNTAPLTDLDAIDRNDGQPVVTDEQREFIRLPAAERERIRAQQPTQGDANVRAVTGDNRPAAQPITDPPSATRPDITVRAGRHPTFERLVFDWESNVGYVLERQGNQLNIRFNQQADADLSSVAFQRLTFSNSVRASNTDQGLVFSLLIDPGVEIRDFRLDTKVVVDVLGNTLVTEAVAQPPADLDVPVQPPVAQVPATPEPVQETAGVVPAAQPPVPPVQGDAVPGAPVGADPAQPLVADPAQPLLDQVPVPDNVDLTPVTDSVDLVVVPADAAAITPGIEADGAITQDTLGDNVTNIRIDPNNPAAVVVFTRANYLWVAFGLPNLRVSPLIQGPAATQVRRADVIALEGGTAYRFPLPPGLHPRVTRDGRVWNIALSSTVTPAPTARIEIEGTDVSAGKRLSIALDVAGTTLELIDPSIGDRLILIPALEPGRAVREARRLPQLSFIPAVQGIVIRPLTNALAVRPGTETVKVEAPGGLLLSADREALLKAAAQSPGTIEGLRLFDLSLWRRGERDLFHDNKTALQLVIAREPANTRSIAYLDLARLYFAHGFGAEAQGLVELAIETSPDLAEQPEIRALRGAARALEGGGIAALDDLEIQALEIQPEAALWRGVALSRLGRWVEAGQQFVRSGDTLLAYPDELYAEIAVIMAEALLVIDETNAAEALLDELDRRGATTRINRPALNYLRGDLALRQGDPEDGRRLWELVANSRSDQLYRVKAQYGLVELGLGNGSMTQEEALQRLEKLRFAWRGDTLELAILRRLGTLYLDTGDFFAGFELLRRAAGYFPGSTQAQQLTGDLAQAFRRLYVDGEAASMSPIEAYALFDEFRELNPIGETGDQVIKVLAERLIEVDLLTEAGELLQQQVEFRAQGREKARLGARLAAVRLLDNLPELALEALSLSQVDDSIPADLAEGRALLEARAHQNLGDPDQALAVISGLDSRESDRLRADIGQRFGRWALAGRALVNLLDPPPVDNTPPSSRQIQLIMNAAVALSLANEQPGLNRLRETYGDAMALTPLADSFRLVTRELSTSLLADLDTLQNQMQEVDLFSDFLDSYRRIQDEAADEPLPASDAGTNNGAQTADVTGVGQPS